jgi:peptidoglycan hydrolase CwlO-like protein
MLSQTTLTKEPRVQTLINQKGDTLIQFHIEDARILLVDVLDKQVLDSIVEVYKVRDSISQNQIQLYVNDVRLLQEKSANKDTENANLNTIIGLRNTEIAILNETIKQDKKEIRKQKFYKVLGIIGAIALPILVLTLK